MSLFDSLNIAQKDALETQEGPLLVLAGAGSGKTRVVTLKITALLQAGVNPKSILGVTFINKAANEMKERVHLLTQQAVLICTFHSLGVRILRESISLLGYSPSFTIYDEEDAERILKSCIEPFVKPEKSLVAELREAISRFKSQYHADEATIAGNNGINSLLPQVYRAYQHLLKECNALDYDDLLLLPVKLFHEFPEVCEHYQDRWHYLLIDEYQDTNAIQYELIRLLTAKRQNICAVGDPDQSIYSWRGANIENILNFKDDYPQGKIVFLEENYRSTTTILTAANAVISNNRQRYEKNLFSSKGEGEKIKLFRADDERDEAQFIAKQILQHQKNSAISLNEMVVFYRTNAQSRALEDCFLYHKIPYVVVGGLSFYQRREIKDLLAWMRMIHSGADIVSFERTINLPKRGLGASTIDKLMEGAKAARQTISAFCEQLLKSENQTEIKLTSKQLSGLKQYIALLDQLREQSSSITLSELLKLTIEVTQYRDYLKEDPLSFEDRMENVAALVSKAAEFEGFANVTLSQFLEELSLKSALDEADTDNGQAVTLMTLHNGKGLEFQVAFISGMEEELFPHVNSYISEKAVEEERRLFYVGITRAKEILYLSYTIVRTIWGARRSQRASRFLSEIPPQTLEKVIYARSGSSSTYSPPSKPSVPWRKPAPFVERLEVGEWVFHKEFGMGQIQDAHESSAGLTYRILFNKDHKERNLVAQFAELTRIT